MTFIAFESAQETGRPAELYDFRIGSESFKLTSWANDVTVGIGTFTADVVERSRLAVTQDARENDVEITIPADNPFVLAYEGVAVPGKRSTLVLYRTHVNDPDTETVVFFKGNVTNISRSADGREAKVNVVSFMKSQALVVPRRTYQGLCNHSLYDGFCTISETDPDFQKFLNVSAVSTDGLVLTVDTAGSFGADFFQAGFIEYIGEPRMVVEQGGTGNNDFTIRIPFEISPLGATIRCLAGCDHRLVETCDPKFNNANNYGGFPFVPLKNPFNTQAL